MIGTTDDVVECEKCGKADLRATVILELIDTDGNGEGVSYYGSTCAARALASRGVRTAGSKILEEARIAQRRREELRTDALQRLDFYGLPSAGQPDRETWLAALAQFRTSNAIAYRNNPRKDPESDLRSLLATWQEQA